ncbi:MAG: hypothetical protein EU539_08395 [Promethearchaeota archaeon]|nr:MAG: hypothetical protein EU539_08395 [Candidatus Lokiarchaeota archaeon]
MMLFFKINDYLSLKLENGLTNIYIDEDLFIQCKYLLLNIPQQEIESVNNIKSIDEAAKFLNNSLEGSMPKNFYLDPKVEFWGHCSNLQAWYEEGYDVRLIHSNLAFSLLKKLAEAGDKEAKKVFKEEIAKKLETGHLKTIQFLMANQYLDFLNQKEISCVLEQSLSNLFTQLVQNLEILFQSPFKNYFKVRSLFEIILLLDLKHGMNTFYHVFKELSNSIKKEFATRFILYLNYKEILGYKLPYRKFFLFFEKILKYIYLEYPELRDFLNLIETGYLDGNISLDDRFLYGTT